MMRYIEKHFSSGKKLTSQAPTRSAGEYSSVEYFFKSHHPSNRIDGYELIRSGRIYSPNGLGRQYDNDNIYSAVSEKRPKDPIIGGIEVSPGIFQKRSLIFFNT